MEILNQHQYFETVFILISKYFRKYTFFNLFAIAESFLLQNSNNLARTKLKPV